MLTRLLSFLASLPLVIFVILFAVSNRQLVTVGLFPLPFTLELQFFILPLVFLLFGLILGGLLGWISSLPARYQLRACRRQLERAETTLAEYRASPPAPDASLPQLAAPNKPA